MDAKLFKTFTPIVNLDKVLDEAKLVEAIALDKVSTGELLGEGHLAMTVDQGSATTRYQGIVTLKRQSLEEVAHQYFRQSEQIPTRVRLGVGTVTTGGRPQWRAGGIANAYLQCLGGQGQGRKGEGNNGITHD